MLPKHPKQAEILFYTKDYCPYCVATENLLNQKGVAYTEIDVTHDSVKYQEMSLKLGLEERFTNFY